MMIFTAGLLFIPKFMDVWENGTIVKIMTATVYGWILLWEEKNVWLGKSYGVPERVIWKKMEWWDNIFSSVSSESDICFKVS